METAVIMFLNITIIAQIMNMFNYISQQQKTLLEQQQKLQQTQEQTQDKLKLKLIKSGVLTAEATEKEVISYSQDEPFTLTGWISLKNMVDGDTVVIRQSHQLSSDPEYTLFAERTYRDARKEPLLLISPTVALKSTKITLTQTTGTPKQFPYEFHKGGTM